MQTKLMVAVALAAMTLSGAALADDAATPGVTTLPTTVIYGRVQRPSVVLEVRRIEPWVAVKELSRPRVGNAEDATKRAPF